MSPDFIDALTRHDLEAVKRVPKTDLHNHSTFGTRIERVEEWASVRLQRPPSRMHGIHGMVSYARQTLNPHIHSREGFEFTAEYATQDAIEDNVRALEMSFGVRSTLFYPDREQGLVRFVKSLRTKYEHQIDLRPELGFIREDLQNEELRGLAEKCVDTGCFSSIDLYGDENACPPKTFQPLFRQARRRGMRLKAHAGEFGGAETVRRTVETLELDAVQHGIGAAESPDVMRWLSRNRITLNICPTSNVALGAVESLGAHPIRKLYDHGVRVTINTDDLMIFGQSASEEYLNLYRAGVFSAGELDGIRETALRSVILCSETM